MKKVKLVETVAGLRRKIDGWGVSPAAPADDRDAYRTPKKTANSPAQKPPRVRFGAAQAYAAEVLSDPLRRHVYQKLGAEWKRYPMRCSFQIS